jgi:hypothetical protein
VGPDFVPEWDNWIILKNAPKSQNKLPRTEKPKRDRRSKVVLGQPDLFLIKAAA